MPAKPLPAERSPAAAANGLAGDTFRFGIVGSSGNTAFFGFLDAMRKYSLAKVVAEPTLVTISGRPASFNDGGEIPILEPGGLGTTTIDWKKFGTQVDFVPIVLGNGRIRLEVRPRVSQLDYSIGVTIPGTTTTTPGLDVREVDTGVEMQPGQTLAIAGLLYKEVDYTNTGIPLLGRFAVVRCRVSQHASNRVNEKELLIMVTPELVDAMNPGEVPPCMPGMCSVSPNDAQLYGRGYSEVPACGPCGAGWCGSPGGCCANGGRRVDRHSTWKVRNAGVQRTENRRQTPVRFRWTQTSRSSTLLPIDPIAPIRKGAPSAGSSGAQRTGSGIRRPDRL